MRSRDLTVPWVADVRTFVLVGPPDVTSGVLARFLANEGSFVSGYGDEYLPVRSVVVLGRRVGVGLRDALHDHGFEVAVYTASTGSRVVAPGTDAGFWQGGSRSGMVVTGMFPVN